MQTLLCISSQQNSVLGVPKIHFNHNNNIKISSHWSHSYSLTAVMWQIGPWNCSHCKTSDQHTRTPNNRPGAGSFTVQLNPTLEPAYTACQTTTILNSVRPAQVEGKIGPNTSVTDRLMYVFWKALEMEGRASYRSN